jgi:hypothetical protein
VGSISDEGTLRAVAGGASDVRFERPDGTAAAMFAREAVSHLRFDGRRVGSVAAGSRLRSERFAGAADRYEFELSAASRVTIGLHTG